MSKRGCRTHGTGKRRRVPAALVCACAALLWGCRTLPEDPSLAVDALLSRGRSGVAPGVAVMVIRDGAVLKKAGYGMADLEHRVPIQTDTAFRLASVSKQFTAMAVMMLEEEGRLHYDDPITRLLPEMSRFGDGITIRQLMHHTSGLPDYYDVMVEVSGVERPLTRDALGVFSKWGELLSAPNERYEYSSPGYELLALIVERASGERFPEFMQSRIFGPLGMTSSLVYDEREPEIANRAYGYRKRWLRGYELYDDDPLNYIFGSGGIYSTVEDLYSWDQALYGEQLVSRGTLEEAYRPARLADGEEVPYGFGWGLEPHLGRRCVAHEGGWVGFSTYIARYPDDRLSVIVLSNLEQTEAGELADRIAALYLDETQKTRRASN